MMLTARTLLAASLLLCSCDDGPSGPSLDPCEPRQELATVCDDDNLLECDGEFWRVKEDCEAREMVCVERVSGIARCEEEDPSLAYCPYTEFCPEPDEVCGEITLLSDEELCFVDCSSDPSMCDSMSTDTGVVPGYCEPGEIDDGTFSSAPFCYPLHGRNGVCLLNDDGCSEAGGFCQTVALGLNPECKLPCPSDEIGSPSNCANGETCLPATYLDFEEDSGERVECTAFGTTDGCTDSDGYLCTAVPASGGGFDPYCARPAGICGVEAPVAGPFATLAEVEAYIDDESVMCDLLGADQYCGADAAAGALNECASPGFAFPYATAIRCAGLRDFVGCFGFGVCVSFDDNASFECGVPIGVCQKFCMTADGVDLTQGGSHNPCDGGQSCQLPAYPVGQPAIQHDDGVPRSCLDNPSACTGEFSCDPDTSVCTQVRKVCGD